MSARESMKLCRTDGRSQVEVRAAFFLVGTRRLIAVVRGGVWRRVTRSALFRSCSSIFFSAVVTTLENFSGRSSTIARSLAIHFSDSCAG